MGKKRMGRPPAGPGGSKVEDLPRVTIRLEPELLDQARAYARQVGRPLWRIIQDLLREHLERQAGEPPATSGPAAPPSQEPPAELAAAPVEALRRLELTYVVGIVARDLLQSAGSAPGGGCAAVPLALARRRRPGELRGARA